VILLSALFGTASYVCYYKAIATIGASKAMALNITYSAWAIIFSLILLHTVPDLKSIVCGVIIVISSVAAAADIDGFVAKKQKA
ncbi:MAG TPA: EamA family transporter, partial [Lachnospiraceae bacterium]|nr:EamA family transporter [Lachnospiraceae bacterium]